MIIQKDKASKILEDLDNGLTWSQITKKYHVSPNTIKKIIEDNEYTQLSKERSARTKALEMYNRGCIPFEVATKLDISAENAKRYLCDYLDLRSLHDFRKFYEHHKQVFPALVSLNNELQAKQINLTEVSLIMKDIHIRNELQMELNSLEADIRKDQRTLSRMNGQKEQLYAELDDITTRKNEMERIYVNYREENRIYREEEQRRRLVQQRN